MIDLAAELRRFSSAFAPQHRKPLDQLGLPSNLMLYVSELRIGRIKAHGV